MVILSNTVQYPASLYFFWFFEMENGFEMMFVNASRLLLMLRPRLACRFKGNKAGNRITTFRLEI